jgi:hypothetical protein
MKQVGARHDIIREWRSLPKEQRQTDKQAEAFAMQIKDKYKFSNDSANPYQTVRGWLLSYLSLTRGLEVNAKDKREMPDDEKSTDPGLSAAERKALRVREAQEAIADHEEAQTAFHENRERLPQRTPGSRGDRGSDARSHSRTAGRYADRTRIVFQQDPERSPSSRPEKPLARSARYRTRH